MPGQVYSQYSNFENNAENLAFQKAVRELLNETNQLHNELNKLSFGTEIYQDEMVTGRVTSSETGEPLPGVTVMIKGTTTGVITDENGNYNISDVESSSVLVFSFVGMRQQEIIVGDQTEINVELEPETIALDEVVAVGYGTIRREQVTSSVATVRSDEFAVASARDPGAMIKGKVAGLSIIEPSGDPTEDTEISLRGTISLVGSSQPLILIDGVPGDFNTVAPEQIQSIDVLKDGSAAAIYGSRGSNGVILITTKRNVDQRTLIQYEGYTDVQTIARKPDLQSADDYRENIAGSPFYEDFGYDTDWIDAITRTPVSHSHTLTLMGGQAKTSYSGFVNYRNNQGIFLNSDNEDMRVRANLTHNMFDDKLEILFSLSGRQQNYHQQSDGQSFDGYVYRQALIRNPTDRIYDDDGNYQIRDGFRYDNPLILLNEGGGAAENNEIIFSGTVTWTPVENFSVSAMGSATRWRMQRGYAESFDHISTRKNNVNGLASIANGAMDDNLLEITSGYENRFGSHNVTVLGGYSYQEVINSSSYMSNRDFPTDLFEWNSIDKGVALPEGRASMSSGKNSYKLIGFFSRLNYDFKNRYMLMGSMRYEGSSRLGKDSQWGLFPAISGGWRISEESFMENVSFIADLKLRAGFGVTGIVPTSPYQSLTSYSFGGNMFYNGEWIYGLEPARNSNPDLRWERKEEINVGLDFSILGHRLWGSIDIYRRDTKDLLRNMGVPVPPNLFGSTMLNVGHIRNDGFETMIEGIVTEEADFQWNSSLTYSTNRNELVSLTEDVSTEDVLTTGSIDEPLQQPTHRAFVGGPLGNFIGYKSVGLDDTGAWIVLDENGEEISIRDASPDDWQVLGNGIPKHHFAWSNYVKFRDFDLKLTMRGSFGFQIANWQRMYYENPTVEQYNMLNSAFDPVYGKRLDYPLENVSYYYEDGDYWKIDNLTIGYNINVGFVDQARVYVAGRNLLTITGYKGIDPEVSFTGLTPGLDERDKYPTTRTYTIGLSFTF